MSTCPGTGGAPAGIPIDAAPPERVIEQPEAGLYLAGTFDNPSAAAAPYRIVPALVRAHSGRRRASPSSPR